MNKIKKAVAIKYDKDDSAPKIIAKGKGIIAEKIIDKASESNVPIYEDEKLTNILSNLELEELIPPDLYEVVAQVLIFVSDIDKLHKKYYG